jgi:hypothetical protein
LICLISQFILIREKQEKKQTCYLRHATPCFAGKWRRHQVMIEQKAIADFYFANDLVNHAA